MHFSQHKINFTCDLECHRFARAMTCTISSCEACTSSRYIKTSAQITSCTHHTKHDLLSAIGLEAWMSAREASVRSPSHCMHGSRVWGCATSQLIVSVHACTSVSSEIASCRRRRRRMAGDKWWWSLLPAFTNNFFSDFSETADTLCGTAAAAVVRLYCD